MRFLRVGAALLVVLLTGAACQRPAPPEEQAAEASPEPTLQPDDRVDLTVYFRNGGGEHLTPAVREVDVSDDLPRRALELLLAGPTAEEQDGEGLVAPLPTSTRLLSFEVDDGTALVDLSAHVIRDAPEVVASPHNELLALAAVAGTLTEFPAIDRVRLTVEGAASGWRGGVNVDRFWGGWGLPEMLVRDETVLGPSAREGEGVPDLDEFSSDRQELGGNGGAGVAVSTVRLRSRTTYLRLMVEVSDPDDPDAQPAVPTARALPDGTAIILDLDGVTAYRAEIAAGQRLGVDDPVFEALSVEVTELPGTVRLRLSLTEPREFRLHRLSSPTRIALDVKK